MDMLSSKVMWLWWLRLTLTLAVVCAGLRIPEAEAFLSRPVRAACISVVVVAYAAAAVFLFLLYRSYRISEADGVITVVRSAVLKKVTVVRCENVMAVRLVRTPLCTLLGLSAVVLKLEGLSVYLPPMQNQYARKYLSLLPEAALPAKTETADD